MPVITNNLTSAPAEFNDGHHMFAEIGLNLTWRQVLEGITQNDANEIFDILARRKDIMDADRREAAEAAAEPEAAEPKPMGGRKRGKSSS